MNQGTLFEERRGVNCVEATEGFVQVSLYQLPDPVHSARLKALNAIGEAKVAIDFLKFTVDGLAFLILQKDAQATAQALEAFGAKHIVEANKSLVTVEAVSVRDSEGLVASILATAVETGVELDHIGDSHDRILLVVDEKDAPKLVERLKKKYLEASYED